MVCISQARGHRDGYDRCGARRGAEAPTASAGPRRAGHVHRCRRVAAPARLPRDGYPAAPRRAPPPHPRPPAARGRGRCRVTADVAARPGPCRRRRRRRRRCHCHQTGGRVGVAGER
nr:uncharacterized protein LOC123283575 [Equus asinus]